MKRTFQLEDLDCANCAAKIEQSLKRLDGVTGAEVNFFSQKMVLEAPKERFDDIAKTAVKLIQKIEPDITVKRMA